MFPPLVDNTQTPLPWRRCTPAQDSIACENTAVCKNYSKLEWAFSQGAALEVLDAWTAKGRAAMALSAGEYVAC